LNGTLPPYREIIDNDDNSVRKTICWMRFLKKFSFPNISDENGISRRIDPVESYLEADYAT
jgi:hypothetical protein